MIARCGHLSLILGRERRSSTKTIKRSWPTQRSTNITTQRVSFGSTATPRLRQDAGQSQDFRPPKCRKPYSLDEDTVIILRRTEGFPNSSIAEELNRSKPSISQRVKALSQYYPSLPKRGRGLAAADQAEVVSIQRSIFDDGLSITEVCQKIGRSYPYVRRRLDFRQRHPRQRRIAEIEALVLAMKAQGYKYESIAHKLDIEIVKVQNVLAAHTRSRQRTPEENLKRIPKLREHYGWPADEDSKLLMLYEQGQRAPEIARELNRHLINTRARLRGLLISKGRLVPNGKLRYGQGNLEQVVNLREESELTWKQIAERFPERSFRAWQWQYFAHKKRIKLGYEGASFHHTA
ncbi:hypothetical protein AC578_5940 [Pseudocercospora eumusae]|uniref:Uncharacterized protein n=1 Tax=Pseudocercospora eumusae TaxID=321146 RepID=A0A139HIE6_9PEZI|nr:hypothetical protein AC578_5940 [Pseudocercospora eumusae]